MGDLCLLCDDAAAVRGVAGGETGADATGEEMSAWYSGVNVRTPGDVASAELDLAPEAVLFRDVLSQLSHFC